MTTRHDTKLFRCPRCKYVLVNDVDDNGMVRCPECGTISSPALIEAQRGSLSRRTRILWICLIPYLLANAVLVVLARAGVLHLPWRIVVLQSLSFFVPLLAVATIAIAQIMTRGRAFRWIAACSIAGLVSILAFVNLFFLALEAAAE